MVVSVKICLCINLVTSVEDSAIACIKDVLWILISFLLKYDKQQN